jgi:hypothetical protein
MAHSEQAQAMLLSTTENLFIKKVRGKFVINTMPDQLTFSAPGTLLECQQCMDNASWRGVLIGTCTKCSPNGLGYDEKKKSHAMPCNPCAAPFGYYSGFAYEVCEKINELLDSHLDEKTTILVSEPRAIKTNDAYSFYNLAQLQDEEFRLLLSTREAVEIFANRYYIAGPDDKRYLAIYLTIHMLRGIFSPHCKEFYKKCEKMEKEWILCTEATSQEEVNLALHKKQKETSIQPCHYCGDIKPILLCGNCKSIRYCSVACQTRDWENGGAYTFNNGELSSPHKESCEYLNELRLEQKNFEASAEMMPKTPSMQSRPFSKVFCMTRHMKMRFHNPQNCENLIV